MSNKCPACGNHIVRPSHFRGHKEREANPIRSPYRCLACGARFFVISHKTRQVATGLFVGLGVFAAFAWFFAPDTTTSNLRNAAAPSQERYSPRNHVAPISR